MCEGKIEWGGCRQDHSKGEGDYDVCFYHNRSFFGLGTVIYWIEQMHPPDPLYIKNNLTEFY